MFRILLLAMLAVLAAYTGVVVVNHGLNFWPTAFADIGKMEWPGQFDVDFLLMLTLSGLWVSWRHGFTLSGLALGVLAFLGGALFLTVYLSILAFRTKGDVRAMMIGSGA
ncbi:MAG: hypothetical protein ABI743_15295 [bacterium]